MPKILRQQGAVPLLGFLGPNSTFPPSAVPRLARQFLQLLRLCCLSHLLCLFSPTVHVQMINSIEFFLLTKLAWVLVFLVAVEHQEDKCSLEHICIANLVILEHTV